MPFKFVLCTSDLCFSFFHFCRTCQLGKQHRTPFPSESIWKTKRPLQLIHSDICGPMSVSSFGGNRYFISFIGDYTRKVWVYCIQQKSEAFQKFKDFKAEVENFTRLKINTLRTDRGGEYIANEFQKFCKDNGIRHEMTARHAPQQNSVCERKNRTIMEMARCLLKKKKLPSKFWAEAVSCAVES